MRIAIVTVDNRDEFRSYAEPEPRFGPPITALLAGLQRIPDCEFHVVACVQRPVRAPERLAANVFYHSLLVPKWGWLRGGYLGCVRAIRRKLDELRPEVVHGQGTERYCGLAAAWSGFPNVLTIHGNLRAVARVNRARPGSFLWLAARLEGFTLPRAGGVLCNSDYTESLVRPVARRIWRIPNAIQEEFFNPVHAPRSLGRPVLLCVGIVQARKRQLELLDWALDLRRRGLEFELRFLGAVAPKESYAAEFLRRAGSPECLEWVTHHTTWDTPAVVQEMDRASSLIHFPNEEAFGMVVAEGLARNLKLFGARVGGVPEVAAGAEGAELLGSEDWAGLAAAVQRWFAAGLPQPASAADSIRRRFHPDVVARQHLEVYRELLAVSK